MPKSFFKKRMPDADTMLKSRWLKPFARYLAHAPLWHLNRRSVARGVAIGLFFAFATPIAQSILAVFASVPLRANIGVATLSTFVTNPLTTPPVLIFAHQVGSWILGRFGHAAPPVEAAASWWSQISAVAGTTAIGLALFATVAAVTGYLLVDGLWRLHLVKRWQARRG